MRATIVKIEADLFQKTADIKFSYKTGSTLNVMGMDGDEVAEFEITRSLHIVKDYHIGEEVEIIFKTIDNPPKRY